jgi:flavin-dependent dehydrogenase
MCTLYPQDPFISAALGPNAKLERMRAAALRLGGQGLSATHDDHLLIIGDAAGHIDPLTGRWQGRMGL